MKYRSTTILAALGILLTMFLLGWVAADGPKISPIVTALHAYLMGGWFGAQIGINEAEDKAAKARTAKAWDDAREKYRREASR